MNGHRKEDLDALARAHGIPAYLKEMHISRDGPVTFGDETDGILDNRAIIEKSMEMTGVGADLEQALRMIDAI